MAGDIEMELMVDGVGGHINYNNTLVLSVPAIPIFYNFWEKIILDFVINHHLLNGFLQPPQTTKYGEWKEEF